MATTTSCYVGGEGPTQDRREIDDDDPWINPGARSDQNFEADPAVAMRSAPEAQESPENFQAPSKIPNLAGRLGSEDLRERPRTPENLRKTCEHLRTISNLRAGHLGLSEALLEPSWAILDDPMGRGHPPPGPGDGFRRGRGKDRRINALNHARPEGWRDYPCSPYNPRTSVRRRRRR